MYQQLLRRLRPATPARQAYDQWAPRYDSQPGNLMLALDEIVFTALLQHTDLRDKVVVDIGCGTGRHWPLLFEQQPASLTGYDVSEGMLDILRQKYPAATVRILHNDLLPGLASESCDVLLSTLTIAHIPDAYKAIQEWARVTRPGGNIFITDFHPAALAGGATRSFSVAGKKVTIKNYVHSLDKLQQFADALGLRIVNTIEKYIDEDTRPYYEQQGALSLYEQYKGSPVIYGMHLKKNHAV